MRNWGVFPMPGSKNCWACCLMSAGRLDTTSGVNGFLTCPSMKESTNPGRYVDSSAKRRPDTFASPEAGSRHDANLMVPALTVAVRSRQCCFALVNDYG